MKFPRFWKVESLTEKNISCYLFPTIWNATAFPYEDDLRKKKSNKGKSEKINKMSQASPAPLVMNEISHALRAILVMNKEKEKASAEFLLPDGGQS